MPSDHFRLLSHSILNNDIIRSFMFTLLSELILTAYDNNKMTSNQPPGDQYATVVKRPVIEAP